MIVTNAKVEFTQQDDSSFKIDGEVVGKKEFVSELVKYSIFFFPLTQTLMEKIVNIAFDLDNAFVGLGEKSKKVFSLSWAFVGLFFVIYNVGLNLKPYKFSSREGA